MCTAFGIDRPLLEKCLADFSDKAYVVGEILVSQSNVDRQLKMIHDKAGQEGKISLASYELPLDFLVQQVKERTEIFPAE